MRKNERHRIGEDDLIKYKCEEGWETHDETIKQNDSWFILKVQRDCNILYHTIKWSLLFIKIDIIGLNHVKILYSFYVICFIFYIILLLHLWHNKMLLK